MKVIIEYSKEEEKEVKEVFMDFWNEFNELEDGRLKFVLEPPIGNAQVGRLTIGFEDDL